MTYGAPTYGTTYSQPAATYTVGAQPAAQQD